MKTLTQITASVTKRLAETSAGQPVFQLSFNKKGVLKNAVKTQLDALEKSLKSIGSKIPAILEANQMTDRAAVYISFSVKPEKDWSAGVDVPPFTVKVTAANTRENLTWKTGFAKKVLSDVNQLLAPLNLGKPKISIEKGHPTMYINLVYPPKNMG